jgi:hypothetical protein
MIATLRLLLPALIPSWRFFSAVAPSPRVEYALLPRPGARAKNWREFRSRPARLSLWQMLGRMLWNPVWNEQLFLVSCAERLMETPTAHSIDEIARRVSAGIPAAPAGEAEPGYLQFRLVFVSREGAVILRDVEYTSEVLPRAIAPRTGRAQ